MLAIFSDSIEEKLAWNIHYLILLLISIKSIWFTSLQYKLPK